MKTIRIRKRGLKVFGFENWFGAYGKNARGLYQIDISPDFGLFSKELIPIYKSKKRPIIRNLNLLAFIFTPLCLLFVPTFPIIAVIIYYFKGARSFIVDSSNYYGVRFFGWTNFILMVVLIILLTINSL
jgi:hypothetical protein